VNAGIVHAANSAATILYPEAHYNMVRCGIAIYGLQPSADTEKVLGLVPAMSVKARASLVKRIGMGDSVSYGYVDGQRAHHDRHASAGIRRRRAPRAVQLDGRADRQEEVRQVGRVCMDQLMVEVERGNEVRRGDEAVIVASRAARLRSGTLAVASTINYELACGFGLRWAPLPLAVRLAVACRTHGLEWVSLKASP
jgi:alanine racemase